MDLAATRTLLQALKGIDQSKQYIAQTNGNFYRVETKDKKNLNTAGIAEVAKKAFETLHNSKSSYSAKAKLYEEFSQSIQDCINRIYKHKTFWQKIAWWLGCASSGEKELWNLNRQSQKMAKKWNNQETHARKCIKLIMDSHTKELNSSPKLQLKLNYTGLLDSSTLKIDHLDGLNPCQASIWLLKYLKDYRQQLGPKSPHISLVESVIQEFRLHNDLLFAITDAKNPQIKDSFGGLNLEDWIVNEILSSFQSLKNSGDEIVLGGGYSIGNDGKKDNGHTMQFVIRLETDGNYSLTFINSGEGSELSPKKSVTPSSSPHRKNAVDIVWDGIPKEALSEEFIQILIKRRLHNIPSCMDDIKKEIVQYLSRFPSVRIGKGREHKIHHKGSCTVKSLTSWLHERLKEPIWRDFKLFYSKCEMQKSALIARIHDVNIRNQYTVEAKRILIKREVKKVAAAAA